MWKGELLRGRPRIFSLRSGRSRKFGRLFPLPPLSSLAAGGEEDDAAQRKDDDQRKQQTPQPLVWMSGLAAIDCLLDAALELTPLGLRHRPPLRVNYSFAVFAFEAKNIRSSPGRGGEEVADGLVGAGGFKSAFSLPFADDLRHPPAARGV